MRTTLPASLLATLILAAPAAADHTLRHRVVKLERKLACLVKLPVSQFYDYGWYGQDPGYPNWALVWDYDGPPPHTFMLALRQDRLGEPPTRKCRRLWRTGHHPVPPAERLIVGKLPE